MPSRQRRSPEETSLYESTKANVRLLSDDRYRLDTLGHVLFEVGLNACSM